MTARPLSAEEEQSLQDWLSRDSRHLGAYAQASAAMAYMEKAKALGSGFDPQQFVGTKQPKLSRRRVLKISAVAATVCIVTAGGLLRLFGGRTVGTGVGETRVIPLPDGSVVTINTATKIAVEETETSRRVRLLGGEALFDVAKDKKRPFIVQAGNTLVRAVGTSFIVQYLPDRPVRVLVREGIVEVTQRGRPQNGPVQVNRNAQAVISNTAPALVRTVAKSEIERELAWREGRIAFEDDTLRHAADSFARYSDIKIVFDDPAIADRTITGYFVSNDPVGFSKAVAVSLHLQVRLDGENIHLSNKDTHSASPPVPSAI